MPQVAPTSLISKTDNHLASEVDGEIVLMGIEDGKFFSLSGTGKAIWEALESYNKVSDIITHLTNRYDVAEDVCRTETLTLLADLQARKIIDVK